MTNTLSSDAMTWLSFFFKEMWKFFAWLTIPGTNLSVGLVIVSAAAISIITRLLKSFTYISKGDSINAGRRRDSGSGE